MNNKTKLQAIAAILLDVSNKIKSEELTEEEGEAEFFSRTGIHFRADVARADVIIDKPLVYMSHAITFTDNGKGGPQEPHAVSFLSEMLSEAGAQAFRPLLHNPWNGDVSPPIQVEGKFGALSRNDHIIRKWRKRRHPTRSLPILSLPDVSPKDHRPSMMDLKTSPDGKSPEYIVNVDNSVIWESDMVFALLNPISVGGAMEIVYACGEGIPVIGFVDPGIGPIENVKLSAWAIEHCNHIFNIKHILQENIENILNTYRRK